ncbi:MAG TPA: hypothetical protein VLK36_08390 [Gaiellaceae bacterium]|nr:hypothetical protein [Gaiellaceae bacterium]
MLATQSSPALETVIALSIFVPVIVAAGLAWWVLRGKRDDPDEKLWRLQDDARRRSREREKRPE